MLFSTSDFKHAVCTPAMVLLSQVLAQVVTLFINISPQTLSVPRSGSEQFSDSVGRGKL